MGTNAWLVRPFPHGIKRVEEFKKENIVAIGWPGIGDLTGQSREDIKRILSETPYCYSGLELGNAYATIDIFVNQMNIGDLIISPDGDDIYFAKIVGDYHFEASKDGADVGYSHQRKVTWLNDTSRKQLSKKLRSSLKVHRTTANMSEHVLEIEALATRGIYEESTEALLVDTIKVSYPLRPDCLISFDIPKDISKDEANRLSAYFQTLYFKE